MRAPPQPISGLKRSARVNPFARSMKHCLNISATVWPAMMSVPKSIGTRHSRLNPGCAFGLEATRAYRGQSPETDLGNQEASR